VLLVRPGCDEPQAGSRVGHDCAEQAPVERVLLRPDGERILRAKDTALVPRRFGDLGQPKVVDSRWADRQAEISTGYPSTVFNGL
jgi:hypothetical protein